MRSHGTHLARTLVLAAATLLALPGCVERTLLVKSSPSGAAVAVNGRPVGKTPVVHPFRTYGVYEVTASHPGCKRLEREVSVKAPWYERIPLDFFAENVWPGTIRDEHNILLELAPLSAGDDEAIDLREVEIQDLLENAE